MFLLLLSLSLANSSYAVTTKQTNLPVVDKGKDIYGLNSTGVAKQLIGVNSSNKVSIDENAAGTVLGGNLAIAGNLSVTGNLVIVTPNATLQITTANATTPTGNINIIIKASDGLLYYIKATMGTP